MSPGDWEKIQVAFQRASDSSGPERDAYLETFAREHPGLVVPLRDLLAADAEDRDLGAPIVASLHALLEGADDPWIGKQVGAWTIRERIATGGMRIGSG